MKTYRKYKTIAEYEKEIARMRKKAQALLNEGKLRHMEVDEACLLIFQNKWVIAKNKLRLIKQFPERENT